MKVTNEKIEKSQAFLTIEMEPAEVEESLEKSYRRLVAKAKIPGFRAGKAPRAILERYVGKEGLMDEAIKIMLPDAYEKAIKEQAIEPIAQPQIEITQTEPVIFKAVVPLRPKVKLGDYQNLKVPAEPVEAVTDENVEAVIERLRHAQATWEPVERPVQLNDLLTLDIESTVDGKTYVNRKGAQYQILEGISFPAPGFSELLVGLKKDEEKEFKLTFPADYPRTEVAGKEASFKVKVSEVKQEVLAEVNDEFATGINADFKTVAALRESIAAQLKATAEQRAAAAFEEKVLDAVTGLAEMEYPVILVDSEKHRLFHQRFEEGGQQMEEYLKSINKTEEEVEEELRPLATKRVERSLVLSEIIKAEAITADAPEIDAEIEEIKKRYTEDKRDQLHKVLNTTENRESIGDTLVTRKAIKRVVELVKTEAKAEAKVETVKAEDKKEEAKPKKSRGKKKEEGK